jgi:hypothetical protein
MGAINNAFARHERVDFSAVSSAALNALDFLVPKLLPGGYRSAGEWVARNPTRNDGRPGSFKVNLKTGVWSDFTLAGSRPTTLQRLGPTLFTPISVEWQFWQMC